MVFPPLMLRSLGLDPKMLAEVQKGLATIDFAKVEEFVKKLPTLIKQMDRIDTVFQILGSTELTIEQAAKKVYFVVPLYKEPGVESPEM